MLECEWIFLWEEAIDLLEERGEKTVNWYIWSWGGDNFDVENELKYSWDNKVEDESNEYLGL